ncbi:MAG TPA: hypothetical protein VFX55_10215 [Duganella sp.]|nr:hypothetical protein [Duganella sp.]
MISVHSGLRPPPLSPPAPMVRKHLLRYRLAGDAAGGHHRHARNRSQRLGEFEERRMTSAMFAALMAIT